MTLIAETQDEAKAFLLVNNTSRELVNVILFDTEDAPEEIRHLAKILYGACAMFDEAQKDARLMQKLIHEPPEGRA